MTSILGEFMTKEGETIKSEITVGFKNVQRSLQTQLRTIQAFAQKRGPIFWGRGCEECSGDDNDHDEDDYDENKVVLTTSHNKQSTGFSTVRIWSHIFTIPWNSARKVEI